MTGHRFVARCSFNPQGRVCSRVVEAGRFLSSRPLSTNSIGMAVASPVTRVLPASPCTGLADAWTSLPTAAANRRCDISGIELMVAFHGFWGLLRPRGGSYYPCVFNRRRTFRRRLHAIFGPDIQIIGRSLSDLFEHRRGGITPVMSLLRFVDGY